MKTLTNCYEIRDAIKAVGGRYLVSSKTWTVEDEEYEELLARVEASGRRSNKRDRALFVGWQKVEVSE